MIDRSGSHTKEIVMVVRPAQSGLIPLRRRDAGRTMRRRLLVAALLVLPVTAIAQTASGGAVFVAYFWRAKPGQTEAYNEYIRRTAEPIDDDARRAGAFEEVRTVTPAAGSTTEWTHLRIFRVKNMAAAEALGAALDAATARVVPDESRRKANSERSASLRDFVRREVWTELGK